MNADKRSRGLADLREKLLKIANDIAERGNSNLTRLTSLRSGLVVGVKHRQTFRENHLNAFIAKGWLERTISDKPKSRLQRYRTTEEGKKRAQESADPRPVA
jgi:hypothetical protein